MSVQSGFRLSSASLTYTSVDSISNFRNGQYKRKRKEITDGTNSLFSFSFFLFLGEDALDVMRLDVYFFFILIFFFFLNKTLAYTHCPMNGALGSAAVIRCWGSNLNINQVVNQEGADIFRPFCCLSIVLSFSRLFDLKNRAIEPKVGKIRLIQGDRKCDAPDNQKRGLPHHIDDSETRVHGSRVRRWRCWPDGRCPGAAELPSGNRRHPIRCDSDGAGSAPGTQFRPRWRWTGYVGDETGIRSLHCHPSSHLLDWIISTHCMILRFLTLYASHP